MSPGITEQSVISDLSLLLNLLVRRVAILLAILHPSSAQITHCYLLPHNHIVVPQPSLSSVSASWGLFSLRDPSGTPQPDV